MVAYWKSVMPRSPEVATGSNPSRRSACLDDHQSVFLRITEPEHGRHLVAEATDLGVHVDAPGVQLLVVGVDVVDLERDTGLLPALLSVRTRRAEGDRRLGPLGRHFNPAAAVRRERHVGALLESE